MAITDPIAPLSPQSGARSFSPLPAPTPTPLITPSRGTASPTRVGPVAEYIIPNSKIYNDPIEGTPTPAAPTAPTPTPDPAPSAPTFNLSNDPNVADSLALEQQGYGQLDAALKAAREKAVIGFGDPSLAGAAGFNLDPQSAAFARQNYQSGNATEARLDKAHTLARQAVINRLAAHGILGSGDLGYQEGQADQSYGNQLYDAKNQLLDYLSNLFNSYNQNRTQLHQATIAARQNALNAFAANPDAYAQYFGG